MPVAEYARVLFVRAMEADDVKFAINDSLRRHDQKVEAAKEAIYAERARKKAQEAKKEKLLRKKEKLLRETQAGIKELKAEEQAVADAVWEKQQHLNQIQHLVKRGMTDRGLTMNDNLRKLQYEVKRLKTEECEESYLNFTYSPNHSIDAEHPHRKLTPEERNREEYGERIRHEQQQADEGE